MKREYEAWTIYGEFLKLREPKGAGPFYKACGDFLPFFTTKKAAESFIRDHFNQDSEEIKATVRKVTVRMDDCGVEE